MFTDHDYAPKSSWKIKMKDSSRSASKMTVNSKQSTRSGIHMVQSFLMPALELKHYGDLLHWHDENSKIFAIRWQHKRGNQWTDKDAAVFVGWDQMKGRHGDASSSEYLVEAKQRFRNALRKIHNIRRIATHDRNYRLYQIVSERDSEAIDIAKVLLSLRSGVNQKFCDQSTQTEKDARKRRKQEIITPHISSDSESGIEDVEEQRDVEQTMSDYNIKAEVGEDSDTSCCDTKPIDYTKQKDVSTQVEAKSQAHVPTPSPSDVTNAATVIKQNPSIPIPPQQAIILNHMPIKIEAPSQVQQNSHEILNHLPKILALCPSSGGAPGSTFIPVEATIKKEKEF